MMKDNQEKFRQWKRVTAYESWNGRKCHLL